MGCQQAFIKSQCNGDRHDVFFVRVRQFARAVLATALGLLVLSPRAVAQLSTASVNGVVRDQSGAVIPSAIINLRNVDTSVTRTTQTNSSGNYVFVDITPGRYTLKVSKTGFATQQQNVVTLAVNQTARFDFVLSVGAAVQEVTVSGAAAQLQTSTANLGTIFDRSAVNNLPLNGRNFTQLLTLSPGASPANTSQNNKNQSSILLGTFSFPSINGQMNRSNMYLLDGMNDLQPNFSQYDVPPIVDAIQEFKMQSHNDQSEFGGVMGGVINVVTKSGTNQYHGDVWEFLRNDALDATNPLLEKKIPLKQNVFGATMGGPVMAPFYNGHNRTFFFGAYEGTRIISASSLLYNVPTPAELAGDFSAIPEKLYNPFSTVPDPARPGEYLRTPFPDNQIQKYLDPHMVALAKALFPAPISTPSGFNGEDTKPTSTDANNFSIRLDQRLGNADSVWFRFNQIYISQSLSGGIVGLVSHNNSSGQTWAADWVHTFGSSATLEAQVGRTWGDLNQTVLFTNHSTSIFGATGYNNSFACSFLVGSYSCLMPSSIITGYLSGGESHHIATPTNLYEYKANFTKLMGNHTFQTGFDLTPNGGDQGNSDATVTYSNFQTSNLEHSAGTGDAMASFLLGVPSSGSRRNLEKNLLGGWVNGFYAEDQWKALPRLTIDYGLRYDMVVPPRLGANATQAQMSGAYDLRNGTYVLTKSAGTLQSCSVLKKAPCIPGGVLPDHVVVGNSNQQINDDLDNIQPRIGFAYQLDSTRVFHLSYSRVYDTWSGIFQGAQNEGALWPSVGNVSAINLNTTIPSADATAEDPLGSQVSGITPATPFNQVAVFVSPHFRDPYSDQWMFGLQQQLGANTVWTLNYVGSRSSRLPCCGFYNVAVTPGPGKPQTRAPFPYIRPTRYERNNGSSSYNAMQVQVRRQMSNGLEYTFNYTWSKTIDVACDGFFGVEGCFVRNPYNPALDRSVAGFDLPNIVSGDMLYELPFGAGRQFQSGSRFVNGVMGGWQLNAVVSLTSGTPFTVSYSGDVANTGNNNQGVDLVGIPNLAHKTPAKWFNTAAFHAPALYTYGNAPRNMLRSDWYRDVDLSLFRDFSIERTRTEFRAEAFNGLNMPVYGTPGAVLNSKTFGKVGSMASTQREVQLAVKVYF